jgi:hypothetical protein
MYCKHRVAILAVVKVLMAYQTLHATNSIQDKLYALRPLTSHNPAAAILVKITLISSAPNFVAEVLCMPVPLWQQLAATVFKAVVIFLGRCTRGEAKRAHPALLFHMPQRLR